MRRFSPATEQHGEIPDLFDPRWYAERSGRHGSPTALWRHYRRHGDRAGLSGSPYVDTVFYRRHNPDVPPNISVIEHLLRGIDAGDQRDPHPYISVPDYLDRYPEVAEQGASALLHFLRHGDRERRSPSGAFDADFYARSFLPLGATHPFRHFVEHGQGLGLPARPRHRSSDEATAWVRQHVHDPGRTVLLVGHDAQRAGAPYLLEATAEELETRGWAPVIWLLRGGPLLLAWRERWPSLLLDEGWDLRDLARDLPPGVPVLTSTAVTAAAAADLARAGHRTVCAVHETASWIGQARLLDELWHAAAAGVTLAVLFPRVRTQLLASAPPGLDPSVRTIRFGLFSTVAQPAAGAVRRRAVLGDGSGPLLISAGYADHRKGFDLWLEAVRELARVLPSARFVWLGELDPEARDLLSAHPDVARDLVLPGHVDDAPTWYAASDVFLLTSRQDPGPTVVMDAARAGVPFVAYDTDLGIRGIAEPVGRFVPAGDLRGYVRAVLETLAEEDEGRRTWRRARVEEEISFAGHVDDLLELVGHPPRPR